MKKCAICYDTVIEPTWKNVQSVVKLYSNQLLKLEKCAICLDTVLNSTWKYVLSALILYSSQLKKICNLLWYCTQTNLKKVLSAVILKKCAICCPISLTTTWIHLLWYCNWTHLKKCAIFCNTVLESTWNNVQSAVILHSKPTWKNVQSAVILYLNQLEKMCNLLWYC